MRLHKSIHRIAGVLLSFSFLYGAFAAGSSSPISSRSDSLPAAKAPGEPAPSSDEDIVDSGGFSLPPAKIIMPAKEPSQKPAGSARLNAGSAAQRESLIRIAADSAVSRALSHDREVFRNLGDYHRLVGVYGIATGALAILTGVLFLDKPAYSPWAMAAITMGGVTIGLGIWEIKLGAGLMRE
jgi:hypothetical protein